MHSCCITFFHWSKLPIMHFYPVRLLLFQVSAHVFLKCLFGLFDGCIILWNNAGRLHCRRYNCHYLHWLSSNPTLVGNIVLYTMFSTYTLNIIRDTFSLHKTTCGRMYLYSTGFNIRWIGIMLFTENILVFTMNLTWRSSYGIHVSIVYCTT